MKKLAVNPTTSPKKPRGKPFSGKGDPRNNLAGAPKRGESWAEIIKRVGEYTPQEAAEKSIELSKQFLKVGEGVTLKEAVVMRVYGALLFEPQPGLLNAFMERTEGKITQTLLDIDLSTLTDEQLQRLKDGEGIESVIINSRGNRDRISQAPDSQSSE